jgi:hypothetical protein
MSNYEVWESRMHVVVLQDFSCTCGKPRQYHFLCSHLVAAARNRNYDIESKIPREYSVDTLVHTWSPDMCLFETLESSHHTMGQSTLRIQLIIGASVDLGRGRGTRWLWIRYLKERGVGEEPHFLLTSSSTSVASVVDWATIHALAINRLVRCDYWLFLLFHIYCIVSINYECLNLCF